MRRFKAPQPPVGRRLFLGPASCQTDTADSSRLRGCDDRLQLRWTGVRNGANDVSDARVERDVGVVGRDPERAALRDFLDANEPPRALLLVGGPGAGKTTLWDVGVAGARERGLRVLVARPSGAEAEHSFSALIDLFDGIEPGDAGESAGTAARGARGGVVAGGADRRRPRSPMPLAWGC